MLFLIVSSYGCHSGFHIGFSRSIEMHRNGTYRQMANKLKDSGFDCVILDFKTVYGEVGTPFDHPLARKTHAFKYDLRPLADYFRSQGLYVIGRVVIFKDPPLKEVIGEGYEVWVFPGNETVEEYNRSVIRAIVPHVDEVQLDYVRWEDASVGVSISQRRKRLLRSLRNIVAVVPDSIPVSLDIFGRIPMRIKGWNDIIGQDIYELLKIADILSPMAYPSHYWGILYDPYQAPYQTMLNMLSFGVPEERTRVWLQAFGWKVPDSMGIVRYITEQLNSMYDLGIQKYMFWMPKIDSTLLANRRWKEDLPQSDPDGFEVIGVADSIFPAFSADMFGEYSRDTNLINYDGPGLLDFQLRIYRTVMDARLMNGGWLIKSWFSPLKVEGLQFHNWDVKISEIHGKNLGFAYIRERWPWMNEPVNTVVLINLNGRNNGQFRRNFTALWRGDDRPRRVELLEKDGLLYFQVKDSTGTILATSPLIKSEWLR